MLTRLDQLVYVYMSCTHMREIACVYLCITDTMLDASDIVCHKFLAEAFRAFFLQAPLDTDWHCCMHT